MPSVMERAKKIFLVPDIFVYMFTGKEMNEPSELSTTQMLDVRTMAISREQCEYAGVSPELFSEIGRHGRLIGKYWMRLGLRMISRLSACLPMILRVR